MKKYEWIFIDFDGTLVDSLNSLYNVYLNFLKKFNIVGNKNEFTKLNGPTLTEIVSYFKKRYNINENESELLKTYEHEIELSYSQNVKPIPGREILLDFFRKNGYNVALVTSCSQKIILSYLNDHNWNSFFDVIIYGDLVTHSKPDPEIYNLALTKAKCDREKILVLEDSENGYISAKKAGLNCIVVHNKSQQEIFSLFQ
ncbi:phosphoglycolate phosphatase [Candidatus Nitrosopumilus koreensis AR1]|uniref:Phosphoglycolate phosphatase n=1 Tax=Candidatus Nitrosopumilus koreensis AR1 TaxID=1229908 RepID=K0B1Y5_9ARCH|nr:MULTISPECIES: HAD-IA family hydrolase [Nitrosopumilus]AFS80023.1 phosphoglycolate phosphatase [Candidatus Nitrosopumilus koreensis AR1]